MCPRRPHAAQADMQAAGYGWAVRQCASGQLLDTLRDMPAEGGEYADCGGQRDALRRLAQVACHAATPTPLSPCVQCHHTRYIAVTCRRPFFCAACLISPRAALFTRRS